MEKKVLMKGNEAIAEAAIRSGCRHFFGYPITPQTEISAYMAKRMPKIGGTFLQAESEVAAINMVYGAAGAGARVMTSSSSPGISLKAEGISYIAGADLPCVIVNMVRGGPGLGGIQPAQSDYFQAVKGGGHGDYHLLVLAPNSVPELSELTMKAFDLADNYRCPVMILGDGTLGQMMEPVVFDDDYKPDIPEKPWATVGTGGRRKHNVINTLYMTPEDLEYTVVEREKKYDLIKSNEVRYESIYADDAEYIVCSYGTTSRVVQTAVEGLRAEGIKIGTIRPITLWPFPYEALNKAADKARMFFSVEMSMGQMVEDVRLAVNGKAPVYFMGRTGGVIPTPSEVADGIKEIIGGERK
ncbi:MAG: 3-methyl-2-oxobutanoate dehydrogenase subunit VorB [Oscillospiraceae bacterium]|nr:3-methyl-2-oxobutanoate dehydrogenase subunit VorB [Oscillospiraceae bacterium]